MQLYKRQHYYLYRLYSAGMHRLRRRTTKTAWMLLIGITITAAFGVDTNLSVAYQLFTLLFTLLLVASVSTFFCRVKFSAHRILPKFGSVGERMDYKIVLKNETRRTQHGLGILDEAPDPRPSLREFLETPEPGEEKRNFYDRMNAWYRWQWLTDQNVRATIKEQAVPPLTPEVATEMHCELVPLKRGYFRLAAITLTCPDPFGVFRALRKVPSEQSILILPKRYLLPPIELPGKSQYQQGGVAMASSVGQSEEFVSLRDYRAGDPMRHIHWKSWAKTGRPIVKEFQDEFFVRHALILDTFWPTLHSDIFEEAVSVAASFAYTIQTRDSLLDLLFVGAQAYCFTSGRGVGQAEQMLEILACVQICQDKRFSSLQQLVLEHASSVSGCICILLAWDEERKQFVQRLKIAGTPVKVFVVVPAESKEKFELGPMANEPENFHVLETGKIAQTLGAL
ncbi:MAG: hypothetical protein JWM68_4687 [Verrucomicrobiales bacterium]|nr:hypothetical protein [Verrucomicrobiales bacterium]